MKPFILLLLAVVWAACADAQEEPARTNAFYASYELVSADAEEAVAALQQMVGAAGRLVFYRPNSRLLVYGSPDAHQMVRDSLQQLAAPRENVRIEVAFNEQGSGSSAGIGVTGQGQVTIGSGGTHGTWTLTPRLEASSGTSDSLTRQHILMQSGNEASIAVGQEVPFVQELVQWGRQWGYITREIEMRHVGAVLKVRARVIGDGPLVQVTLTPELSALVDNRAERIRYTRVATSVTVQDGATITLGSFGEHTDFYRQFLAGLNRTKQATDTQITLRVAIESPTGGAPGVW